MPEAYFNVNGAAFSPFDSSCMVLEKKVDIRTLKKREQHTSGMNVFDIKLDYSMLDVPYAAFLYCDSNTIVNSEWGVGFCMNSDDDTGKSCLLFQSASSNFPLNVPYPLILCIYRKVQEADKNKKDGFYFNVYNESGTLALSYSTPPLIFTRAIPIEYSFACQRVGSPRRISGDFSDEMILVSALGVIEDTLAGTTYVVNTNVPTLNNVSISAHSIQSYVDSTDNLEFQIADQLILARRV